MQLCKQVWLRTCTIFNNTIEWLMNSSEEKYKGNTFLRNILHINIHIRLSEMSQFYPRKKRYYKISSSTHRRCRIDQIVTLLTRHHKSKAIIQSEPISCICFAFASWLFSFTLQIEILSPVLNEIAIAEDINGSWPDDGFSTGHIDRYDFERFEKRAIENLIRLGVVPHALLIRFLGVSKQICVSSCGKIKSVSS